MVAAVTSRTGGAAASTLASTALPISIMPRNWPLRVERGGAGKAGHRHRLAQFDRAAVGQPRLDLGQLAAAVLLLRIGNADQRQVARLWRVARERQRRDLARAIDAQQRQPVVLVVGDAVGVAEAGGDDHLAALRQLAGR